MSTRIDYRTEECMVRQRQYGRIRSRALKLLVEIHKEEFVELMEIARLEFQERER